MNCCCVVVDKAFRYSATLPVFERNRKGEAYMMLVSVVARAILCNVVVGSPFDRNVPKVKSVEEAIQWHTRNYSTIYTERILNVISPN